MAVYAATALRFGPEINVSQTPTPTEKAKVVRLAYAHGGSFRKVWLFTYADGAIDRQNVYARFSSDEGVSWSTPVLLSRDAALAPTGGQLITTKGSLSFVADNDKPSIFAPPVTSGPLVLITWNSAYCPRDPGAPDNRGSYVNPLQGAGDFNVDGVPDRAFHCVWVATTTDPTLATWDVQQLTNGERDAINEVVSGSSTGNAFAMAWQEDPAGLQPGEGEGRGDGGMGSQVTGGTNIWYTHAPSPSGATLRANLVQLSDNNLLGTGNPGASRPNLQLSATTAVLAYEETACPGGASGKCIVYHSFPYSTHDTNSGGTVISDAAQNARRVRFALQGSTMAGSSPLRVLLLWRETPFVTPAAPSDIVVRRGLLDPARPGSTGLLASDVLADPPQRLTNVARSGGNANAHRALMRGNLAIVAYDSTPDMNAADPEKTSPPTSNYNLFVTRSKDNGSAGSWSAPVNLSRLESPTLTVVEPRMVPTPATVVNPLTGASDPGDVQNPDAIFVSYATETNSLVGKAGRVFVARSTDQSANFDRFLPVSPTQSGQSEAQLRATPDGSSVAVTWMGEQVPGDPSTKDAIFASGAPFHLPDLSVAGSTPAFPVNTNHTLTLLVSNRGAGGATKVLVTGRVPEPVKPVGITEPATCSFAGARFNCLLDTLAASQTGKVVLTVTSSTEGTFVLDVAVSGDEPEVSVADNSASVALTVTASPVSETPPIPTPTPPPTPTPAPPAPVLVTSSGGGGGCTLAGADGAWDPVLLLLLAGGLVGAIRRGADARRSFDCAGSLGDN